MAVQQLHERHFASVELLSALASDYLKRVAQEERHPEDSSMVGIA